jgi:hypothetical protein
MQIFFEAIHSYVFVELIEKFGVFESALVLTTSVYLIGFPFYLIFKRILPTKSRLWLLIYCLTSSAIGSFSFWKAPELGVSYDVILVLPILLLPLIAYSFFVMLDKVGIAKNNKQSNSLLPLALFLFVLLSIPVAAVLDWTFFDGQYILVNTGDYSVILTFFGLSAIGAFTCLLLLMPIVGLVSLMSAIIRWLNKFRVRNSKTSSVIKLEPNRGKMKLQDCGCGGTPHVTVNSEDKNLFIVSCPICGVSTLGYDNLRNAQLIWNTWCSRQGIRLTEEAAV